MDTELEAFKKEINLTDYALSRGYALDPKESSRASLVLRGPDHDKLIVAKDSDGHWIYFSVRDDADNGSIIDFHQQRTGDNLGRTRQALRPWVGMPSLNGSTQVKTATPLDRHHLLKCFHQTEPITHHPYLEARGLSRDILGKPLFCGRIRTDNRNNVLFPHRDAAGFSGFEIKNLGFTGFSPGGQKALWLSRAVGKKKRLVVCESAIDALSFAALYAPKATGFASTGGAWSPQTETLLRRVASLSSLHEIVLAFDNDPDGDHHAERARSFLQSFDITLTRKKPEKAKDWNELLMKTRRS